MSSAAATGSAACTAVSTKCWSPISSGFSQSAHQSFRSGTGFVNGARGEDGGGEGPEGRIVVRFRVIFPPGVQAGEGEELLIGVVDVERGFLLRGGVGLPLVVARRRHKGAVRFDGAAPCRLVGEAFCPGVECREFGFELGGPERSEGPPSRLQPAYGIITACSGMNDDGDRLGWLDVSAGAPVVEVSPGRVEGAQEFAGCI